MIWPEPTHQPTHPPTNQIIHPPMGGEVSTDFKSSNRIEISRFVQVLLNFKWFRGSPPGGGGLLGWGWRVVRGCILPTCTCMCTRMHAHAHICVYDIIGNSQVFPQWGRPFAWNYHVYHTCVCVRAHACTPRPPPPPYTHPPPPEPQGAQNTKIQ